MEKYTTAYSRCICEGTWMMLMAVGTWNNRLGLCKKFHLFTCMVNCVTHSFAFCPYLMCSGSAQCKSQMFQMCLCILIFRKEVFVFMHGSNVDRLVHEACGLGQIIA